MQNLVPVEAQYSRVDSILWSCMQRPPRVVGGREGPSWTLTATPSIGPQVGGRDGICHSSHGDVSGGGGGEGENTFYPAHVQQQRRARYIRQSHSSRRVCSHASAAVLPDAEDNLEMSGYSPPPHEHDKKHDAVQQHNDAPTKKMKRPAPAPLIRESSGSGSGSGSFSSSGTNSSRISSTTSSFRTSASTSSGYTLQGLSELGISRSSPASPLGSLFPLQLQQKQKQQQQQIPSRDFWAHGPITKTTTPTPGLGFRARAATVPRTSHGHGIAANGSPTLATTASPMAKIEFYTWENLPPIDLVSYCIEAGYSTNSGFSRLFNPISQDEAMEMVRRTYSGRDARSSSGSSNSNSKSNGSSSSNSNNSRTKVLRSEQQQQQSGAEAGDGGRWAFTHDSSSGMGASASATAGPENSTVSGENSRDPKIAISPSKQQSNSQLCEVLLLAATGSQYCEEPLQESIQKALFDSAKWYLDVAFGRDASDMQRMRCSMMVAIYLIFAKNINAMEYISQAMTIVQAFRQQRQHTLQHHTQKQRQQQSPHHHTTNNTHTLAHRRYSQSRSVTEYLIGPATLSDDLHPVKRPAAADSYPTRKQCGSPEGRPGLPHLPDSVDSAPAHPTATSVVDDRDLRRAWQSLLFLDGWLASTVGSIPHRVKAGGTTISISEEWSSQWPAPPVEHSVDPYYHNDDALGPDLHSQLASLGVLMGAITADVVAPESVHINTIKTYSDRLKAWHANLPDCLTLSTAVRESYDSPLKNSTLLIHCAYLGSIILLTRRLHVERVAARVGIDGKFDASNHASGSKGDVQEDFSRMCVSAAGQLATVVGMLRTEHRLTRRCWLISQSSYTAALIISLEVAIHRGRPMLESAFTDNMSLISRCLPVLSHCASFDAVAARYLSILTPIHAALSAPQTNRRTHQQPSNEDLLDHILELMRTPFGGERGVLGPECDLFSVRGTLPEGWRFLVQPQPVFPGHGSSASSQSSGHSSGNRAKIDVEDNFSVAGGGGGGGGRKYPHRTREEYEAFFRRTT